MKLVIRLAFILLILVPEVGAAEKLDAITNQNELNTFAQTYYLQPRPDLVESALEYVNSSGLAKNENAKAPLLMSFSCIFSVNENDRKKQWTKVIATLGDTAKHLFTRAIDTSPDDLLNQVTTSPAKNDMNWACFFATGDFGYLNDIIKTLGYLDERSDINLFLTAASAKWSLSSNVRGHPKIRKAMEAIMVGDDLKMRPIAQEIIDKSPQQIRDETVTILKSQKAKGVW